jgi:plastocyanin
VPIAGAKTAVYTTPVTAAGDDQTVYWVSLCNGPYTKLSNRVVLTVVSQAPTITYQPKNITAMEGTRVTFTLASSGAPPPTYQWQRWNGAVWANIWGATTTGYTFTAWSSDNGAFFRAMVTNAAGSTFSSIACLAVQYLHITAGPASQLVAVGTRAMFWVGVDANPANVTYQWYSSPPGAAIRGATTSSYMTPSSSLQNNGTLYWVTVSVKAGNQVAFAVAASATTGPLRRRGGDRGSGELSSVGLHQPGPGGGR